MIRRNPRNGSQEIRPAVAITLVGPAGLSRTLPPTRQVLPPATPRDLSVRGGEGLNLAHLRRIPNGRSRSGTGHSPDFAASSFAKATARQVRRRQDYGAARRTACRPHIRRSRKVVIPGAAARIAPIAQVCCAPEFGYVRLRKYSCVAPFPAVRFVVTLYRTRGEIMALRIRWCSGTVKHIRQLGS
jgi:hypothetical protein